MASDSLPPGLWGWRRGMPQAWVKIEAMAWEMLWASPLVKPAAWRSERVWATVSERVWRSVLERGKVWAMALQKGTERVLETASAKASVLGWASALASVWV
jgi:hypothetical protein